MTEQTTDRLDAPIPTVGRRMLLRGADQSCIAALAAVALIAIGFSASSPGGDQRGVIDLRYPVAADRVQQVETGFQLDVNRAAWPEWTLLPRIGETLARRIVDSRDKEGRFESCDELRRVSGIGPKTLANIRPYLLAVNADDTLEQP